MQWLQKCVKFYIRETHGTSPCIFSKPPEDLWSGDVPKECETQVQLPPRRASPISLLLKKIRTLTLLCQGRNLGHDFRGPVPGRNTNLRRNTNPYLTPPCCSLPTPATSYCLFWNKCLWGRVVKLPNKQTKLSLAWISLAREQLYQHHRGPNRGQKQANVNSKFLHCHRGIPKFVFGFQSVFMRLKINFQHCKTGVILKNKQKQLKGLSV